MGLSGQDGRKTIIGREEDAKGRNEIGEWQVLPRLSVLHASRSGNDSGVFGGRRWVSMISGDRKYSLMQRERLRALNTRVSLLMRRRFKVLP